MQLFEQSGFIGSASWNCSRIALRQIERGLRIVRRRQIVLTDLAFPLAGVLFTRHVAKIEDALDRHLVGLEAPAALDDQRVATVPVTR